MQDNYFSIDLSTGNYHVDMVTNNIEKGAGILARADRRRLMIAGIADKDNEFTKYSFTINVREKGLRLQLTDPNSSVSALNVEKAEKAVTVYLAGDSTVCDQLEEPWAGWGQMFPCFFEKGIAIDNHAQSGRATKSFIHEGRLKEILRIIKEGDYLFIQFAHNDQKPESPVYTKPYTTYQETLKIYIDEARKHGAIPVLVTSMYRRFFNEDSTIKNTLGEYPAAMRQLAEREGVILIDLNIKSKYFYESLGPEGSKDAFVYYPAGTFPDQEEELKDDTHFNEYGAYELARLVAEGIRENIPDLTKSLRNSKVMLDGRKLIRKY